MILSERGNKIILLDNSQVLIANIFSVAKQEQKIDENFIRHLVLNTYRMVKTKFGDTYGDLVICDDTSNCWRKDCFEHYKANRKKNQDKSAIDWSDVFGVMNIIRNEVRETFPYKCLSVDRVEADDIIAVLSRKYHTSEKILIVSNDKDFQQLQRYENVDQYSPIRKDFLSCDNPEEFLTDHIIKGDSSDGIPNILSDDDVFLMQDKRQKPCGKKKIGIIKESLSEWTGTDKWKRNQSLIDLNSLPKQYESAILAEYEKEPVGKRSNMLNYFIENKLKNLMPNIEEF